MPEETQLQGLAGPERTNLLIPRRAWTGRWSKRSSPLFCTSTLLGAKPDACNCPLVAFPALFPLALLPGSRLAASCAQAGACGSLGRAGSSLLWLFPSYPVHPARLLARPHTPAHPSAGAAMVGVTSPPPLTCRRGCCCLPRPKQQKGCPSLHRTFKNRGLNKASLQHWEPSSFRCSRRLLIQLLMMSRKG